MCLDFNNHIHSFFWFLPQLAEKNIPRSMDANGEFLLYD
jgi:hypothetical protein